MDLEKLIEIRHDLLKSAVEEDKNGLIWAINDLDTFIFKESYILGLKKEILSDIDNRSETTEKPKREFKVGDVVKITANKTNHSIPLETICVLESTHILDSWLIWHSGRRWGVLESDIEHTT